VKICIPYHYNKQKGYKMTMEENLGDEQRQVRAIS
jgi:hypothetical protein